MNIGIKYNSLITQAFEKLIFKRVYFLLTTTTTTTTTTTKQNTQLCLGLTARMTKRALAMNQPF